MNTVLTNAAMWALIVGFLSPIVIQLIAKSKEDSRVQAVIAFVFELVVTFPTVYFAGNLNGVRSYVTGALIVVSATVVAYQGFWKPIGVTPSTVTIDRGSRTVVKKGVK